MTKTAGEIENAVSPPGRRAVLAGLAIAAAILALYLRALAGEFVNWDDVDYVTGNPHLGRPGGAFLQWSFTTWWHLNWHPLTWLSYGVDHAIWGVDALGFHLTNILFHTANTFLVVWLAWRLYRWTDLPAGASLWGAALVGALFGCHPLHVESVAWVSERKDVLYAFFTLLSVLAYLSYVPAAPRTNVRRGAYALAVVLFALAALSKPMAVTLPAVLLILDAYPLGRLHPGSRWLRVAVIEKLPFFAISAFTTVMTIAAQQAGGALKTGALSLGDRLWVAERALGFYLGKLVAPITLVPLYPLPSAVTPLHWDYLLSLAALVAITAAAFSLRRGAPVVAAGWAFYLVTLLPVIGILQVGDQAAADRYTYLPILGPLFALGALAAVAWEARPQLRRTGAVVAVGVVVLLSLRTAAQIGVWNNSVTLWEHVLAEYPDSATGHYNLGNAYLMRGDLPAAETQWKRTLAIQPQHAMALTELGRLNGQRGSFLEAARYFEAAIEAAPGYATAHFNLAVTLESLRDFEAARRHYLVFLELAPPEHAGAAAQVREKLATW